VGLWRSLISLQAFILRIVLLVRSQRLRLFICHCEKRMMQICGAMQLVGGAPQPLAHCDMKVPGLCCSSSVVLDAPHRELRR
jgi:hypothetical protein